MDPIKEYIAKGREIEAKATPGKVRCENGDIVGFVPSEGEECVLIDDGYGFATREDRELYAHARNHHARLLDALEEAVGAIESHKKEWGGAYPETADVRLYSVLPRIAAILRGEK